MKVFAILLLIGVLLLEARAVVTGRVIEKGRFEWEASGAVALKRSGTAYYEQENLWVGGRYYLNMGPLNETPWIPP